MPSPTCTCSSLLSFLRVLEGPGRGEAGRCFRVEGVLKRGNEISILHKNGWHRYVFSGLISEPALLSKLSPPRLSSVIYPNISQTYSSLACSLLARLHHGNPVLVISIGETGVIQKGGLLERIAIGIGGPVKSDGSTMKVWSLGVTSIKDLLSSEGTTLPDASVHQLKEIPTDMKNARDVALKMKQAGGTSCCLFTSGPNRNFAKLLILHIDNPKSSSIANGLFSLSQELKSCTTSSTTTTTTTTTSATTTTTTTTLSSTGWRSTLMTRVIAKSLLCPLNTSTTMMTSRTVTQNPLSVATITTISSSVIDREKTREMIKLTRMLNPTIAVTPTGADNVKSIVEMKDTIDANRMTTSGYTMGVSSFNPSINPIPLIPYAGTQYDQMHKTFISTRPGTIPLQTPTPMPIPISISNPNPTSTIKPTNININIASPINSQLDQTQLSLSPQTRARLLRETFGEMSRLIATLRE